MVISWLVVCLWILHTCFDSSCLGHQHPIYNHTQCPGVWWWREHRFWDRVCPRRLCFFWVQLSLQIGQPHCWASCCVALCYEGRSKSWLILIHLKTWWCNEELNQLFHLFPLHLSNIPNQFCKRGSFLNKALMFNV